LGRHVPQFGAAQGVLERHVHERGRRLELAKKPF